MKNKIFILVFFVIFGMLSISFVSALDISIDNYYPTPAQAGDYFNIWLGVTNKGTTDVNNAAVKFIPSYPFSLDPGEAEEREINKLKPGGYDTNIIKFKVRVDSGAKEGENQILFQYKDCPSCGWVQKEMSITVVESQTMFDVVLQEVTSEGVFIAIANIGKNPANAVTIRIPEQGDFKTKLVSASIVGNLASGDYTIVGFQIVPKSQLQTQGTQQGAQGSQTRRTQTNMTNVEEKELTVQIDYTDSLGVRRSVFKKLLLNPASLSLMSSGATTGTSTTGTTRGITKTSIFSNTWFWISIILLVIMIGNIIYKRVKEKRKKEK